jgi:hypothetical protein
MMRRPENDVLVTVLFLSVSGTGSHDGPSLLHHECICGYKPFPISVNRGGQYVSSLKIEISTPCLT